MKGTLSSLEFHDITLLTQSHHTLDASRGASSLIVKFVLLWQKKQSRKHEIWKTRNFNIFFFEFSYFRDKGFAFPVYPGWVKESKSLL
jgi:hypothetical protein